jgi:hypothetical protein
MDIFHTQNLPILPFLVWFGCNLGLNNLKFGQEDIFEIHSIWLSWFNLVNLTAKMASYPNFQLFRPKLSPNWTKNGRSSWFDQVLLLLNTECYIVLIGSFVIDIQIWIINEFIFVFCFVFVSRKFCEPKTTDYFWNNSKFWQTYNSDSFAGP